jgi:hypothetical protein
MFICKALCPNYIVQIDGHQFLDPILLNNLKRPSAPISKENRLFFRYLEDATSRFPSGPPAESAVDDFAAFLLRMLDYDEPERVVHQRLEIGFMMCGQKVDAKPDVVIMDGDDYILLVQEDKVRVVDLCQESLRKIDEHISVTCRWTTLSLNLSQRPLPPTMRTTDGARLLD